MSIDTTRDTVERTLRLAVTNRHITPAIEALALAILERAEAAEGKHEVLENFCESYRHESYTMAGLLERAVNERDALQAEVERLRDAQAWRPIGTAPKDGTDFLAYYPQEDDAGNFCDVVSWPQDSQMQRYYGITRDSVDPSHWMPQPAPPKEPHK